MAVRMEVNGTARTVTLRESRTRLYASIDGEPIEASVVAVGSSSFSVLVGGRSYHVDVAAGDAAYDVLVNGESYSVRVLDGAGAAAGAAAAADETGSVEARSPMPGRVLEVLVEPGVEVEQNQSLVIIESMKMENEIRAPRAGRVRRISVAAGAAVKSGDVLAVID